MTHIYRKLALTAAAFAVLTIGTTTTAHASVTVCNDVGSLGGVGIGIWFTMGYTDSTCSASGNVRQVGWFQIPNGRCQIVSNANMSGKTIYSYAITANEITFEWTGPYAWLVPQALNFNDCFRNIQLSCSNAGANCFTRKFRSGSVLGQDVTIHYSLNR